jgi:hypothetical protein
MEKITILRDKSLVGLTPGGTEWAKVVTAYTHIKHVLLKPLFTITTL